MPINPTLQIPNYGCLLKDIDDILSTLGVNRCFVFDNCLKELPDSEESRTKRKETLSMSV